MPLPYGLDELFSQSRTSTIRDMWESEGVINSVSGTTSPRVRVMKRAGRVVGSLAVAYVLRFLAWLPFEILPFLMLTMRPSRWLTSIASSGSLVVATLIFCLFERTSVKWYHGGLGAVAILIVVSLVNADAVGLLNSEEVMTVAASAFLGSVGGLGALLVERLIGRFHGAVGET